MKIILLNSFYLLFLLFSFNAIGGNDYKNINPTCFIQNKGQWDAKVLFKAELQGMDVWIEKTGFTIDHYQYMKDLSGDTSKNTTKPTERQGQVVKFSYINSLEGKASGELPLKTKFNYFMGNDEKRWAKNVNLYQTAIVRNIYPGIDAIYKIVDGKLQYDFFLRTNANPTDIRINVEGADDLKLNDAGEITYRTILGIVNHGKINATTGNENIHCRFIKAEDNMFGFNVENWNKRTKYTDGKVSGYARRHSLVLR